MHYAFEDNQNLYLVIDLMSGGDLRYHIGKHRKFTEEQTSKPSLLISCQSFSWHV
jgi:serine/threonine protein kinase